MTGGGAVLSLRLSPDSAGVRPAGHVCRCCGSAAHGRAGAGASPGFAFCPGRALTAVGARVTQTRRAPRPLAQVALCANTP